MYIQSGNRSTDIENGYQKGMGGGTNYKFGVNIYTLKYLK